MTTINLNVKLSELDILYFVTVCQMHVSLMFALSPLIAGNGLALKEGRE